MVEQPTEMALRLRDQAIAASSSGIVIADVRLPDMPLIYVNPAFERITGYSAAEVLGRNCRFLQGQERQQAGLTELRAAIRDTRDCSVVLHNYRKDGTPFWNELHMSPVFDADGQLTHFIGVQTDITRRKLAEEALALARDSLEARVAERTRELSAANASLERELGKRQAAEAEIRRQAARAEALVRVAVRLNAELDLNTVVSAVCEETSRALGIAAVSVGLYDHERDTIETAASVGLPPDARQRLAPGAKIYAAALRRSPGPFVVVADVLDLGAAPEAEYLRALGVRSLASTRMERHGELIGALGVFQIGQPRQFTAGDLALLQGVANQAAQAIANARLLAQSQSRLRRTQTLLHIDQSIAGSFELQQTLDAIVSGTIEQLEVDAVDILLLDFESQVLTYAAGSGLQRPAGASHSPDPPPGGGGQPGPRRPRAPHRLCSQLGRLRARFQPDGAVGARPLPIVLRRTANRQRPGAWRVGAFQPRRLSEQPGMAGVYGCAGGTSGHCHRRRPPDCRSAALE